MWSQLQKDMHARGHINQRMAAYSENSKAYSFNFNGGLRKRRTSFCLLRTPSPRGKQFLWFWKLTIAFISSLIEVNFCFLDVLIKDKFT